MEAEQEYRWEGPTQWTGCYSSKWGDLLHPDSSKHPAKFAPGLIRRILFHGFNCHWSRGDVIGDPFGGVASAGILCAMSGLKWRGVELEPKFVEIAWKNIQKNHQQIMLSGADGSMMPMIYQGDSRMFDRILGNSLDAVISSPPYANISAGAGGLNHKPAKDATQQAGRSADAPSHNADERYGDHPGQISKLPKGTVDAVITSPPWMKNHAGHISAKQLKDPAKFAEEMSRRSGTGKNHGATPEARARQFERDREKEYGNSEGQIGTEKGETYWQSVAKVYASCFRAIRPGGSMVIVVKDFVRKRKIVPLCADTHRLLESVGFRTENIFHAMLVDQHVDAHPGLFEETDKVVTTKVRKSFWARTAEAKGSPPINHETVLWMVKPKGGADDGR